MKEEFVQKNILNYLKKIGFSKNLKESKLHGHGVDIKVRHEKYGRYYLIEVKGADNPSNEEVAFVHAIGQIITRMNTTGATRYYYGIGLPERSAKIALRRLPYQIAKKLLLHVFSVNKKGEVKRYLPADLKKIQKRK